MATIDYFQRRLDDKRRLTIPVELRPEFLGGEVVITRGFGNYLHLYTKRVWDTNVEPRLNGDILDEQVADLNVKFRFGQQLVRMDEKQGRIVIDQHLLDYAGIKQQIHAIRVGAYWRLTAKPI